MPTIIIAYYIVVSRVGVARFEISFVVLAASYCYGLIRQWAMDRIGMPCSSILIFGCYFNDVCMLGDGKKCSHIITGDKVKFKIYEIENSLLTTLSNYVYFLLNYPQ